MTAVVLTDTWQSTPGLITSIDTPEPDPDYPIDNLLDFSTNTVAGFISANEFYPFDVTLSSAMPLNAIGIAGHNIPPGVRVAVFDATDDQNLVFLENVFTDTAGPNLLHLTQTYNFPAYRFSFESPSISPQIGSMFFGVSTDLPGVQPTPYTPPPLGRDTKLYPNVAFKGSNYMGGHVERTAWQFSIAQNLVSPAWVTSNWLGLAKHIEALPFFYQWDSLLPDDTMYAWTVGISPPKYTDPIYMAFSIKCRGLHVP